MPEGLDAPEMLADPFVREERLQVTLPAVGQDRRHDRAGRDALLVELDRRQGPPRVPPPGGGEDPPPRPPGRGRPLGGPRPPTPRRPRSRRRRSPREPSTAGSRPRSRDP